jgi:ribose transport system permease protein/putative xylitol transport system permease protein
VSGFLASVAGILLTARVGAATPTMGDTAALQTIAAVVMGGTALTGGVGGVHRTLLGVLVITILANGMDTMAVNPYLQLIVQGAVVILAVALTLDRAKISVLK